MRQKTETGYFGPFGGRYVPETLIHALEELEEAYERYKNDPEFEEERDRLASDFVGRPTPLMFAGRLTRKWGGANVWFKREDLAHTGAHKINNTLGQMLLADRMGKKRIIAETGAGQHGVATATVAALYGNECVVYMGEEDTHRQRLNVVRMKLLGAEVVPVLAGSGRSRRRERGHKGLGHQRRGHPLHHRERRRARALPPDRARPPGRHRAEIENQCRERLGSDPDAIVACVGAGSNAIGAFHPFVGREDVRLVGVEAAGRGLATGEHGASLADGKLGVLHGAMSYVLQTEDGQIREAHSISAGLDYPATGPEHAYLKDEGLVEYAASRTTRRWKRSRRAPARRHHPGAGDGPRAPLRREGGPRARPRQEHRRQPLRPRRQGRRGRGATRSAWTRRSERRRSTSLGSETDEAAF